MFAKLFGTESFMELLGTPSFWFTMALIVGFIVVIVYCFKYPKIGGPVLLVLFYVVLIVLTIYSIIQLNLFYSARGGIHGAITGIFNTNEVEVVDDMSFELKNIELVETSDGVYSASITIDESLSIDTKSSLGVFVNGMPCDTTTEIQSDYAIAEYLYSFYDEDKSLICSDVLTLNFAFYDESTYIKISTDGGTLPAEECIKYWHYYFNKNGFVVKIASFESMSSGIVYGAGDVSNYATVTYAIDGHTVFQQVYSVNDTLVIPEIEEKHTDWVLNGELVQDGYVVTQDITLSSSYIYNYNLILVVNNEEHLNTMVQTNYISVDLPTEIMSTDSRYASKYVVDGWTVDRVNMIDTSSYLLTNDLTLYAVGHTEWKVTFSVAGEDSVQWVVEGQSAQEPALPSGFELDYWYKRPDKEIPVDIPNYPIISDLCFVAKGTYLQTITFYVDDEIYTTLSVNYGASVEFPESPVKTGYTFYGWSLDKVVKVDSLVATGNVSVYALFRDSDVALSIRVVNSSGYLIFDDQEITLNHFSDEVVEVLVGNEIRVTNVYCPSLTTCSYSIECDGTYEIINHEIGDDTIKFTDCTYANIVVNYTIRGGSSST